MSILPHNFITGDSVLRGLIGVPAYAFQTTRERGLHSGTREPSGADALNTQYDVHDDNEGYAWRNRTEI